VSELPVGTVFAKHRIDALLGRGGMGVVYRATQLDLDRTVALKVVAPELLQDEAARQRFLRECRLAASLDHPHVIPIHNAGEEDGVPYLVMRYVAGEDARRLVRREGPVDPARAARIVAQVAGALDAAHASGLVHRDVKPANVLLATGEHAYLSDFGLTRHVTSVTRGDEPRHWVGTIDFVAPEQIRGDEVDARADVYALGCTLFYLLTGRVPFPRDSDEATLWAHLTEPPPTVPEQPAFDPVVRRALAKAPDDRYPSAGDLGRAAEAAAAGVPVSVPERAVAQGAAAAVGERTVTLLPTPAGRRLPLIAAGAVAAVAAAGVAFALTRPGSDDPGSPARSAAATPTATPARTGVVAAVRWGSRPNSLASVAGRVWVGAWRTGHLGAINPETNRVQPRLEPPMPGGTVEMVRGDGSLWVITRDRKLLRLDPDTGRRVAAPVTLAMGPTALAVRGDDVWVSQEIQHGPAQVVRIDAATGAVKATMRTAPRVVGMVYAHRRLWSLHERPNVLVGRVPDTMLALKHVRISGAGAGGLAFGAGALWVTVPDQDQLVRYRLRNGNRALVSIAGRPIGVTLRGKRVWVALNGSSMVHSVGARTMRPIGSAIRVPLNPLAIAGTREGLWVTCVGTNVVARVELPF
jgi:hypothetical protein